MIGSYWRSITCRMPQDELGSQKLLVKNHCSTNQWANGFEDPRPWRAHPAESRSWKSVRFYDVLLCPMAGPESRVRPWTSTTSTTMQIHKLPLESERWETDRWDPGVWYFLGILRFLMFPSGLTVFSLRIFGAVGWFSPWTLRSLCPTPCRHIRCWIQHLPMETATFRISVLGQKDGNCTWDIQRWASKISIFALTMQGRCMNMWTCWYTQGESCSSVKSSRYPYLLWPHKEYVNISV